MRAIQYLIVHCSATPPDMDIGVDVIREWHRAKGWSDVGYHYVIRRDGRIEKGRDDSTPGAHAKGYNGHSIGICLVGGVDDSGRSDANFTLDQYQSLYTLLNKLKVIYQNAEILGHRDLPEVHKDCPCFDVRSFLG